MWKLYVLSHQQSSSFTLVTVLDVEEDIKDTGVDCLLWGTGGSSGSETRWTGCFSLSECCGSRQPRPGLRGFDLLNAITFGFDNLQSLKECHVYIRLLQHEANDVYM